MTLSWFTNRDNVSYSTSTKETQDPGKLLSPQISRQCKCGVENSSRFSLRVMEAMRLLQRDVDQPSTSTAEEITDYIRSHYRHDGDLYAQVRTALRQVCSQGLVPGVASSKVRQIGWNASLAHKITRALIILTSRCQKCHFSVKMMTNKLI